MKATKTKTERNKKILSLKKEMTFRQLAKHFNLSEKRVKEIYYREAKKFSTGKGLTAL